MHFFHKPSVPLVGTLCALYVSTLTRGLSPIEIPGVDFQAGSAEPKTTARAVSRTGSQKEPKTMPQSGRPQRGPSFGMSFRPSLSEPILDLRVDLCGGWDIIARAIREGRKRGPRDNPSYNISIFFFCYLPVIQSVSFPYEFLPVVRGRYCLFTAAPNSP
jgi:hypothetical protein